MFDKINHKKNLCLQTKRRKIASFKELIPKVVMPFSETLAAAHKKNLLDEPLKLLQVAHASTRLIKLTNSLIFRSHVSRLHTNADMVEMEDLFQNT